MLRHLRPSDYKVMPWRNGGGSTTELFAEPGPHGFRWRVSIASVADDGPFSIFAGFDRHIMAIAGSGMMLDCEEHGEIAVAPSLIPRQFSGDWTTSARLLDGPVRDFNLMVERAFAASSLQCVKLTSPEMLDDPGIRLIHLITGSVRAECAEGRLLLAEGDSVMSDQAIRLVPLIAEPPPTLASCWIGPVREA